MKLNLTENNLHYPSTNFIQEGDKVEILEIGVGDGEIIAISKGLHLYEYSWELAKTTAGLS